MSKEEKQQGKAAVDLVGSQASQRSAFPAARGTWARSALFCTCMKPAPRSAVHSVGLGSLIRVQLMQLALPCRGTKRAAAVQVGKSGGAWITQALLLGMGSLTAALPVISVSFVAVVSGWIFAVSILGRQMKAST